MILTLKQIEDRGLHRPKGYVKDVISMSKYIGDGKYELSDESWHILANKYRRGLGDIISSVATPIAAALHLPCVDPTTKQLRPESPCAKRKAALNRIQLPFVGAESEGAPLSQ